jgi:hypothetical protein
MPFRPATRAGTKALICLYSESGGGKTKSALLIARGLVGPHGRIGMIDTENRRGELYAGDPDIGHYDVLQLSEPFTPKAYMAAIDEAEEAQFDALVIDSVSHEWEGIGGVLDMAVARANGGQPKFGDWKVPKTEHKHFIDKLMKCSAHVICCGRAHYKSRQIEKKDYAAHGITSNANSTVLRDNYQSIIQEDRFIFEMTVHLQMQNTNPGVPIITKCPDMLLPAFIPGQQITVETGARMAKWYNDGAPASADLAEVFAAAREAAKQGTAAYGDWFSTQHRAAKLELVNSGEHAKNKEAAAAADTPTTTTAGGYVEPTFDD